MKKSVLAAINSIKKSKKKTEVNSANSVKSSSTKFKSPTMASPPTAKPASAPGKGDKSSANALRKTDSEKLGGSIKEMKNQSEGRKLPERKVGKEERSSVPRKVITPNTVVSKSGGKTDPGKVKPERDLTLKKSPPPRSSIKTFDKMRDGILDEAGSRNDSLNQLHSSNKKEMGMSSVANVGGGSEVAVMTMTDGKSGDKSKECPLEIVLEFLEAVMIKDYKKALKLAKEVKQHEPNNALVNEYMSVLGDLVTDEAEESEGSASSSSSSSEESSSSESDSDSSWETTSAEGDKDEESDTGSSSCSENKNKNERKVGVWKP